MYRKVFNLELDLRRNLDLVEKIRDQEIYAQNLYAALCNNDFAPKDCWSILSNLRWNCTWRYAADMVADIRNDQSYINWYCSGTGFKGTDLAGFVEESFVTDEIQQDLDNLGWIILTKHWLHFPE
jgi:hypothetical protein